MDSELLIKIRADLAQVKRKFAELKGVLKEFGVSFDSVDKNAKKAGSSVKKVGNEAQVSGRKLKQSSKDVGVFNKSLSSLKITVGDLVKGFLAFQAVQLVINGVFKGSINAARQLEQSLVGVQKTTGFSQEQIDSYKQSIIGLSAEIPIAVDELAQIGVVAGQLGLGSEGVEAVARFTETIAKATVALPEFAGGAEEIATSVARMGNIFGFTIQEGENYLSTLNELANTTAANASEITNFNRNFAATGKAVGLTSAEVSAFGATLVSLGIRGDDAGTRLTTAFSTVFNKLDDAAKVAGLSTEALKGIFEEDVIKGFKLVVDGLGSISSETEQVTAASELFGLVGARAVRTLVGNFDQLDVNLEKARKAFEDNVSLAEEFEVANKSFNSQLQRTDNIVTALQINFGERLLPTINQGLSDISEGTGRANNSANGFAGTIVALLETFRNGIIIIGKFWAAQLALSVQAFTSISRVVTSFGKDTGEIFSAIGSVISDTFSFAVDVVKQNTAIIANSIVNTIGGSINKVIEQINKLGSSIEDAAKAVGIDIKLTVPKVKVGDIFTVKDAGDLSSRISGAFDGVGNNLSNALSQNGSEFSNLISVISDDFSTAFEDIDKSASRIKNAFSSTNITEQSVKASNDLNKFASNSNGSADQIGKSLSDVGKSAGDLSDDLEKESKSFFDVLDKIQDKFGDTTKDSIDDFIDSIKEQQSELRNQLSNGDIGIDDFTKRFETLGDDLGDAENVIDSLFGDSIKETKEGLKELNDSIVDDYDDLKDKIKETVKETEKLEESISDFAISSKEAVRDLGDEIENSVNDRFFDLSKSLISEKDRLAELTEEFDGIETTGQSGQITSQIENASKKLLELREEEQRRQELASDGSIVRSLDGEIEKQERIVAIANQRLEEEIKRLSESKESSTEEQRALDLSRELLDVKKSIAETESLISRTQDVTGADDSVIDEQVRIASLSEKELAQEKFENQQKELQEKKLILEANTIQELEAIEEIAFSNNIKLQEERLQKLQTIELEKANLKKTENEVAELRRSLETQLADERLTAVRQWGDEYLSILSEAIALQQTLISLQSDSGTGGLSIDGARADGGPVQKGKTYLVGERGPELFRAEKTGSIVSHENLIASMNNLNNMRKLPQFNMNIPVPSSVINKNSNSSSITNANKTINGGLHVYEAPEQKVQDIFDEYLGS